MKIKLSKDKELYIEILNFIKFKYFNDHADKYVSDTHLIIINFLWFHMKYCNYNYDKIKHIYINLKNIEEDNYHQIKILCELLDKIIETNNECHYMKNKPNFNFNYYDVYDSERLYFITGKKSYFEKYYNFLFDNLGEYYFNNKILNIFPKTHNNKKILIKKISDNIWKQH